MPDAIAEIATSLRIVRGDDPGRAAVLSSLLEHLDATLGRLCAEGFVAIRQRLIERCENIGARVSIGEVSGVAIDIDPTGALRVRDDQGVVHAVRAGEIR